MFMLPSGDRKGGGSVGSPEIPLYSFQLFVRVPFKIIINLEHHLKCTAFICPIRQAGMVIKACGNKNSGSSWQH